MNQVFETVVILLCATFLYGKPVFNPGKFPYSKCITTSDGSGISCETLNITKGRHELVSLWPSGPYAIPMSRFGCPEGPSQGWQKGVLKLKESLGKQELQYKFCVKSRHNADMDTGKWIPGMYNIYKAGNICPEGFVEFNRTMHFETFSQTEFTPNFTIMSDTAGNTNLSTGKIQFHMCRRNTSKANTNSSENKMLETEFMLETAGKKNACLQLDGTVASPVTHDADMENTHCLYMPAVSGRCKIPSPCLNGSSYNADSESCDCVPGYTGATCADAILYFLMSKGKFSSSGMSSNGKNLVWYQFDMRRTLSVCEILIEVDITEKERLEGSMYAKCLYDNVMWSFLHGKALECDAEISFNLQTIMFYTEPYRKMQARYFTLVFDETSDGHQRIKSKESVKILHADLPHDQLCNEDLGMMEGNILDFQITTSSRLQEHFPAKPLSTSWCTDESDTTPWILVDLLLVTVVEGISIWSIGANHLVTSETDMGCSSVCLYYGTDIGALSTNKDMSFDIDLPLVEVQTFMLLNPIKVRYLKLEFHGCHGNGSKCIRFELQGCKLSGLLKMSCSNASKMIELETTITSERKPVIQNDSNTAESCSSSCLPNKNCSVARYDENCMHYPVGHFGMWHLSERWNGKLYAKLCVGDPVELFPTLYYPKTEVTTNLEKVNKDAIITTIGYPFPYDIGQHYRWLLNFPSDRYLRIVFTDVSLGYPGESCSDTLRISKGIQTDTQCKEIGHLYNGRGFVIETSESILFLSFMSCLIQRKVTGRGFRAIITGEEIPACLSIDSDMFWSEGRQEVCTEQKMILSSMSVLNLPFVNVNETWEIRAGDHHSIRIQIIDFYVANPRVSGRCKIPSPCLNGGSYNTVSGSCDCVSGYTGATCAEPCAPGWRGYMNKCFFISTSSELWINAARACNATGYLVDVTDAAKNTFLKSSISGEYQYWIGLNDKFKAGNFVWSSNTVPKYYDWGPGEPSNVTGYEECVQISRKIQGQRWSAINCATINRYICETPDFERHVNPCLNGGTYNGVLELCQCASCFSGAKCEVSKFGVADTSKEKAYCNTDPPPDIIHSKTSQITIRFHRYEAPGKTLIRTEGFRLRYSVINHSFENLKDITTSTKVCSKTFGKCYHTMSSLVSWEEAAERCLEGDLQLVSVHSQHEMEFIHYLLREQRNQERSIKMMSDSDIISFQAHIGLRYSISSYMYSKNTFIWENNSPVTYSPWKENNPVDGKDCTRTNFQYFTNETWESEHCTTDLAQYFVCQSSMGTSENIEENSTIVNNCESVVWKRRQRISFTYKQNSCQNWGDLTKEARTDFETRFPNLDVPSESHRDCLDPDNSGVLWCYTTGAGRRLWEPCFMQLFRTRGNSGQAEYTLNPSNDVFKCEDGDEIPISKRCDGVLTCNDFSDEINCSLKGEKHPTNSSGGYLTGNSHRTFEKTPLYLCESGEWISILAKCDDVIDCLDASDEMNCTSVYSEVYHPRPEGCWTCNDSSFEDTRKVCGLNPDCMIVEDVFREPRRCLYDEYSCYNAFDEYSRYMYSRQCIPLYERCNGIEDCTDGSDEILCDSCRDSFHCDDDKCIPLRLTYDNYPDCDDGSDVMKRSVESLTSCDQWWEHGYRSSGNYVIDGITVFCDFSTLKTFGKITMSIRNIDVDMYMNRGRLYTRSPADNCQQFNDTKLQSVINRDDYKCFLEIRSSCQFHYAASIIDEFGDFYKCLCTVDKFKATKYLYKKLVQGQHESDDVRITNNTNEYIRHKSSRCEGENYHVQASISKRYYNVMSASNITIDNRILRNEIPVQIEPWQITCTFDGSSGANGEVSCEDDEDVLPCVYDVDGAGFMTGCRTGSHLQNCGSYKCPPQTVKCPGSYCIPRRFVCDGNIQCPGGEDEYGCACTNASRNVIILIEDGAYQNESYQTAIKLSKQFYTTGSDIRILRYSTQVPLNAYEIEHRLLEIEEVKFYPFQRANRIRSCLYKTMARNFFENIEFTTEKSKGVIFIENSVESAEVGRMMFSNLSRPSFAIYRVFKDFRFTLTQNKPDFYKFVKDVPIKKWNSLWSIGYKRFPEICKAAAEMSCTDAYRCASSKQCIPVENLCDGKPDCILKDDENLCDVRCPDNCTCVGYLIYCQGVNLKPNVIKSVYVGTQSADLSRNHELSHVLMQKTLRFPFMINLNLSFCKIEIVTRNGFFELKKLERLDISHNVIKLLTENTFIDLQHLAFLNMDGNFELQAISPGAFNGLKQIKRLRITGTKLKRIASYTFVNLTLQLLDISNNDIREIEKFAFWNISVAKLDLRRNDISRFSKIIFRKISMLQELQTPAYKFCCIRPCFLEENDCYPQKNEFSSCGDLMRHPILQALLWLVGITASLGNMASIIYRLVYDRERLKIGYGIFVTNLAAADLLMGVYLLIIAVADAVYRSRYIVMDDKWRNSNWCVTAGVLSTVSSEASILFLCLITLDRLLVIKYPFGRVRFGPKKAHICCVVSWVISFTLALIPVIYTDYFKNKFYSRSGVCVALPLTKDKPPGWMYSVLIFVGLNFCTFVIVGFGQTSIFLELRKATGGMKLTTNTRKKDLQVARNLILVTTTDFLCWFPIGLMGLMALNGYSISGDVYAWTVVFILPLNSAINPALYTLTAIMGRQTFNPSTEEQARVDARKGYVLGQFFIDTK